MRILNTYVALCGALVLHANASNAFGSDSVDMEISEERAFPNAKRTTRGQAVVEAAPEGLQFALGASDPTPTGFRGRKAAADKKKALAADKRRAAAAKKTAAAKKALAGEDSAMREVSGGSSTVLLTTPPPEETTGDIEPDEVAGKLDELVGGGETKESAGDTTTEDVEAGGVRKHSEVSKPQTLTPTNITESNFFAPAPIKQEGKRRRMIDEVVSCVGDACSYLWPGVQKIYNIITVLSTAIAVANMIVSVWIGMYGTSEMILLGKVVLWVLAAILPKYKAHFERGQAALSMASLLYTASNVIMRIQAGTLNAQLATLLDRTSKALEQARNDPQGVLANFGRAAMEKARLAASRVDQSAQSLPPSRTTLQPGLFPDKPAGFGMNTTGFSPAPAQYGGAGFMNSGGANGFGGFNTTASSGGGFGMGTGFSPVSAPYSRSGFMNPGGASGFSGFNPTVSSGGGGFGTVPSGSGGFGTDTSSGGFGDFKAASPQLMIAPPMPKFANGAGSIVNTLRPKVSLPVDNSRGLVPFTGVPAPQQMSTYGKALVPFHAPPAVYQTCEAHSAAQGMRDYVQSAGLSAPGDAERIVDPTSLQGLLGLATPIMEGLGVTEAQMNQVMQTYVNPMRETVDYLRHPEPGSFTDYAFKGFHFASLAFVGAATLIPMVAGL